MKAPSQAAVPSSKPRRIDIDGSSDEVPLSISPLAAATATSGTAKARQPLRAWSSCAAAPGSSTAGSATCSKGQAQAKPAAINTSATPSGDTPAHSDNGSSAGPASMPRPTEVSNRPISRPRRSRGAASASQASPLTHTSPPPRPITAAAASLPA